MTDSQSIGNSTIEHCTTRSFWGKGESQKRSQKEGKRKLQCTPHDVTRHGKKVKRKRNGKANRISTMKMSKQKSESIIN